MTPEKEKEILNNFTEFSILYFKRTKELRDSYNRFPESAPRISHNDVKIENYIILSDMLKLYLEKEIELEEYKGKYANLTKSFVINTSKNLECDCLDHILPTCEYHNKLRGGI